MAVAFGLAGRLHLGWLGGRIWAGGCIGAGSAIALGGLGGCIWADSLSASGRPVVLQSGVLACCIWAGWVAAFGWAGWLHLGGLGGWRQQSAPPAKRSANGALRQRSAPPAERLVRRHLFQGKLIGAESSRLLECGGVLGDALAGSSRRSESAEFKTERPREFRYKVLDLLSADEGGGAKKRRGADDRAKALELVETVSSYSRSYSSQAVLMLGERAFKQRCPIASEFNLSL